VTTSKPIDRDIILDIQSEQRSNSSNWDLMEKACSEIQKLRSLLTLSELDSQMVRLDRDSARRELSQRAGVVKAGYLTAREYAAKVDWDCFKEDNHNA